ncbi:ABC transporter ATP-binding protein [Uliginosibacterium sp. H1]|uniref:ABC transporter ATP-binding protein n=1 Tax=Uliginosibacterium sp. H1 TaxID=3114757 RepID=UPI002E19FAD0|nr:ABC transporter ATP-binding protein [Uliginosibacterium sp. H1]
MLRSLRAFRTSASGGIAGRSLSTLFPPIQASILADCIRRSRLLLVAFLLATVLSSLCTIAGPLLFAHAISQVTAGTATTPGLLGTFVLFASTVAGTRVLQNLKGLLCNRLDQAVRNESNKVALSALLDARSAIFIVNNPAAITTLVHNLLRSNSIYVQVLLMMVLAGAADILVAFLAITGYVSGTVAMFVLAYGVIEVWLTFRGNAATRQSLQAAQDRSVEGANLFGNVLGNIVTIRAFRGRRWISGLYDRCCDDVQHQWNRFYGVQIRYTSLQALLLGVQYASILAILVLTLNGPDLVSQLVMVSMVLLLLNQPFELIAYSLRECVVARGLVRPLQDQLDKYRRADAVTATLPLPGEGPPDFELSSLAFGYDAGRKVLDGLSARFRPRNLNFIVGPSGAGKSTLLQILLRLNESYEGEVRVDGTELRAIDEHAYLSAVGYVPQDSLLMNMSIRDNVSFGRDCSDAEILESLSLVRLDEKLQQLAEGMDFVIGERGQLLSGGERQRLAIARALVARPKILILDEASSALDEATERSIFKAIRMIAGRTTVIAVTHRVGVIEPQDHVLDLGATATQQDDSLRA